MQAERAIMKELAVANTNLFALTRWLLKRRTEQDLSSRSNSIDQSIMRVLKQRQAGNK